MNGASPCGRWHPQGNRLMPDGTGRGETRGTWPRARRMSLMGSRERSDEGVPGTDSPTAVVQQQVGDHLATRQIEAVEVRQPVEVAALEHGTALARVVEADHRGQEHAFPAAQDAEGVVEAQHVGAQIPLALGLVQTFTGAIAKTLRAGDLDTTLPCLEKGLGRGAEMPFFPNDLIDDFLRQELVHDEIPPVGSGNGELGPAASFEGTLSRGMAAEVLTRFPRNGTFGIARADVVAGGAVQDFERQELAAVGQGQLTESAERGLLGHGWAPWKSGALSLTGWQLPHAVEKKHQRLGDARPRNGCDADWCVARGEPRGSLKPWLLACADESASMRAASWGGRATSVGNRHLVQPRLMYAETKKSPAASAGRS